MPSCVANVWRLCGLRAHQFDVQTRKVDYVVHNFVAYLDRMEQHTGKITAAQIRGMVPALMHHLDTAAKTRPLTNPLFKSNLDAGEANVSPAQGYRRELQSGLRIPLGVRRPN